MSIQNLISEDIKKAMLAREVDKLAALRSVKSAILLEASKDGSSEISDDIALKIIIKLVKQRKDSAQIYKEQNRHDLESDELKQLEYLELYLPKQLSKDKIEIIIVSTIATTRLEKIILVLLCGVSEILTKLFPRIRKSKNSLYRGGNITMDPRIKINPGKDHIS